MGNLLDSKTENNIPRWFESRTEHLEVPSLSSSVQSLVYIAL